VGIRGWEEHGSSAVAVAGDIDTTKQTLATIHKKEILAISASPSSSSSPPPPSHAIAIGTESKQIMKKKLPPPPSSILTLSTSLSSSIASISKHQQQALHELSVDDVHGGRVRTFEHRDGHYPTHIYLPIKMKRKKLNVNVSLMNDVNKLLKLFELLMKHGWVYRLLRMLSPIVVIILH
jgi:hypothetical protein